MKVRIERDWASNAVRIWFYEPRESGTRLVRIVGPDTLEDETIDPGAIMPPSLVLHEDMLAGIVREASNVVPVSDAATRHLDDAIVVWWSNLENGPRLSPPLGSGHRPGNRSACRVRRERLGRSFHNPNPAARTGRGRGGS